MMCSQLSEHDMALIDHNCGCVGELHLAKRVLLVPGGPTTYRFPCMCVHKSCDMCVAAIIPKHITMSRKSTNCSLQH